jgi:hypothetical protein
MERFLNRAHRKAVTSGALGDLIVKRDTFNGAILSFMARYDVIPCPVCAFPAQLHGEALTAVVTSPASSTPPFSMSQVGPGL